MNIEVIEKSFDTGEKASLRLSNIRGTVNIQAGDRGVIKIRAEKNLDSGDEKSTKIELSQDDKGRVFATTRYDHNGFRFFRWNVPCKVDYDVLVPENCDLKIRGVSNATRIEGISGVLDISTVSGDLELRSLNGELSIKAVSGDVQGKQVNGATRIDTVSGDLDLKLSNIPSLQAKTVSGDLSLETPLGEGPYDFNAVSGNIRMELSQLTGFAVESSSLSGDLRSQIPFSSSNHTRNHHRIEVLGGGVEMRHKSVSGDFYLDSTDEIELSAELPSPISDEVEDLPPSEVLARIERGELSVDEAVGILEQAN